MKKLVLILLFCLAKLTSFCQHTETLIKDTLKMDYPEAPQNASLIVFQVPLKVEFKGRKPEKNIPVAFSVQNATLPALGIKALDDTLFIANSNYRDDASETAFKLRIQLKPGVTFSGNQSFDIFIAGTPAGSTAHHVIIQKKAGAAAENKAVSIKHVPGSVEINPVIKDKPTKAIKSYFLKYEVAGKLATDTIIKLKMESVDDVIAPTALTESITIKAANTRANDTLRDSVKVSFYINSVNDFGDDAHVIVFFENQKSEYDDIVFTRRGLVDPNKPFWIEVGANFDFIDGLEPNNLFAGVFLYKRDISAVHLKRNLTKYKNALSKALRQRDTTAILKVKADSLARAKAWKNLALFGGVYESKSISTLSETNLPRIYYDPLTSPAVGTDSVKLFTDTGITRNVQVVRNISLFFAPQLRLTNHLADEDGLHVFLSGWTELQWQKITRETDFSGLKRKGADSTVSRAAANAFLPKSSKTTLDLKTHYVGLGFPFYFKQGDVNLFANPIFGWSTQMKKSEVQPYLDDEVKTALNIDAANRVWRPFYVFQFRLNEERYGIAFTGEVRGLIMKKSPPIISLSLSKKFDLKKFIEFGR